MKRKAVIRQCSACGGRGLGSSKDKRAGMVFVCDDCRAKGESPVTIERAFRREYAGALAVSKNMDWPGRPAHMGEMLGFGKKA